MLWLLASYVMSGTPLMQEELLSSICKTGAPCGAVRVQCFPRDLEDWLGVRALGPWLMLTVLYSRAQCANCLNLVLPEGQNVSMFAYVCHLLQRGSISVICGIRLAATVTLLTMLAYHVTAAS